MDKFGRSQAHAQFYKLLKSQFSISNDNFNVENRRLSNVADPIERQDALTLQHYQTTRFDCNGQRLRREADPLEDTDAINMGYFVFHFQLLKPAIDSVSNYIAELEKELKTTKQSVEALEADSKANNEKLSTLSEELKRDLQLAYKLIGIYGTSGQ